MASVCCVIVTGVRIIRFRVCCRVSSISSGSKRGNDRPNLSPDRRKPPVASQRTGGDDHDQKSWPDPFAHKTKQIRSFVVHDNIQQCELRVESMKVLPEFGATRAHQAITSIAEWVAQGRSATMMEAIPGAQSSCGNAQRRDSKAARSASLRAEARPSHATQLPETVRR